MAANFQFAVLELRCDPTRKPKLISLGYVLSVLLAGCGTAGGNFSPAIDAPGATKFGTFALGINDVSSQIVGDFFVATGQQHGFLDSGGSFTTIDVRA